jgi:Arc/MetJ-type ribon-helix-helix transcriptional regulator
MARETERVTIRLPPDRLKALIELVESGKYASLSDAIRTAIDRFIDTHFAPNHIRRITIELPKGNVIDLEKLVKDGDSVDVKDAIRCAVREYIRRRMERLLRTVKEKKR